MSITSTTTLVARLLKAANLKVVFAESCTGGLVSGSLTKIPGISAHHCGGVVTYRNETKWPISASRLTSSTSRARHLQRQFPPAPASRPSKSAK